MGPHARALPVPMIVASNGGPLGSMATMALTSCGRASAISQPNGPDCECVSTIAGPILSRSAAPASLLRCCVSFIGDHGFDLRRVESIFRTPDRPFALLGPSPATACASSPAAKFGQFDDDELELVICRCEHAGPAVAG